MGDIKLAIVGGGLAGLSAGCYARANGFDVTILEHNLALGGVCAAWHRGPYLIDGCIHWLTGGPFLRLYEELGIVPDVTLRPLKSFTTYRDARRKWEVTLAADLQRTHDALRAIGPEDGDELARVFEAVSRIADLDPHVDRPPELATLSERLRGVWELRESFGAMVHFRKPLASWIEEDLKNPQLQALFRLLFPPETPTLFLLMVLGYLSRGWLSRPEGGTARFRDALVDRYRQMGGVSLLNTTVEEILVSEGRARGVRLTDGTLVDADIVVSTSSAPETVFRLLAGRFGAKEWRARMETWKMFQPIVLASYGVSTPLDGEPGMLLIDGIDPLMVGNRPNRHLYLRVYNDDPAFAPPGHAVVQAMLETDYDWWATRGARYQAEKDDTTMRVLDALEQHLPRVKGNVQMTDIATPLTFWRSARSWRGAFEGWLPSSDAFKHVSKQLPGLDGFYMAGQWVEPGGGVPMAVMSGRQVVELVCAALGRPFVPPVMRRDQGAVC